MTEKAFVLLSGGIDSAVCLQKALDEHDTVEAIHVDYGQQTEDIEHGNAEAQATAADIPLHTVDYRPVFKHFAEGTVEDKEYSSEETTQDGGHSVGYVPQRNLHLLTTAAAVAEHSTETGDTIVLYYGAQGGDAADYPDCRPAFVEKASAAINQSTEHHDIDLRAPLIEKSKKQVLQLGMDLGVNWEATFSCYNADGERACGSCPACLERKEAFDEVDVDDPIDYVND